MIFGLSLPKKEAQFHRLMREFPWLWGINDNWDCTTQHIIVNQDVRALLNSRDVQERKFWVKLGGFGERLIAVMVSPETRVVDAVIEAVKALKLHYLVQYLAGVHDGGVCVYRAPNRENLHHILISIICPHLNFS